MPHNVEHCWAACAQTQTRTQTSYQTPYQTRPNYCHSYCPVALCVAPHLHLHLHLHIFWLPALAGASKHYLKYYLCLTFAPQWLLNCLAFGCQFLHTSIPYTYVYVFVFFLFLLFFSLCHRQNTQAHICCLKLQADAVLNRDFYPSLSLYIYVYVYTDFVNICFRDKANTGVSWKIKSRKN